MKEKMRIIKQIIPLIIIFIILLSRNFTVSAAQDWSAVWERLKDKDLSTDNISMWESDGNALAMTDARDISESELLALDQEDRRAYILFSAAFIAANTGKLVANSDVPPNDICKGMKRSIEILESNVTDLTDEEKTKINEFKTMASNLVTDENEEARFESFEDFLANATIPQIQEALELNGYRDKNGRIVEFTKEQREQVLEKQDENVDDTNEAAENNKPDQSVLDRKPIGLLPEKDGDGQITVDETIDGAMDFINSGQKDVIIQDRLQGITKSLYNVLLVVAMVVAVITGLIIAIKFMTSSVEGKAEVKKVLLPYIISCAVTFGSFAIWKLVVEILNNLE